MCVCVCVCVAGRQVVEGEETWEEMRLELGVADTCLVDWMVGSVF